MFFHWDAAAADTWKVRVRLTAEKPALPAWLAVNEQVPAETNVKDVPLTAHTAGVSEVNVTGRPEDALANRAGATTPSVCVTGAMKEMVWVCAVDVEGAQLALDAAPQLPSVHRKLAIPMLGVVELTRAEEPEGVVLGVAVQLLIPTVQFNAWLTQDIGAGTAQVSAVVVQAPLLATPLVVVTVLLCVMEPTWPAGQASV